MLTVIQVITISNVIMITNADRQPQCSELECLPWHWKVVGLTNGLLFLSDIRMSFYLDRPTEYELSDLIWESNDNYTLLWTPGVLWSRIIDIPLDPGFKVTKIIIIAKNYPQINCNMPKVSL